MAEDRAKNGGGLIAWLAKNKTVFGSDVYSAYTFEYVWGANQFGHVLIGLFPGLLVVWLICGSPWAALIVVVLYAAKELVDYLIAVRLVENVFQPNIKEALLDGVVDWAFVAWGAFVAAAVLGGMALIWQILSFAGTLGFFLLMQRVYLPGKISFDRSGLPKFVRLPTFPEGFDFGMAKTDPRYSQAKAQFAARILEFANGHDTCPVKHLVIAGPRSSGRSTFALAVGGDAASGPRRKKGLKVRYVTAAQLHEIANDRFEVASEERPWCVSEADLLIVDELDPALLPLADPAKIEAALGRLVMVGHGKFQGIPVFRRPLGVRNPNATPENGEPTWIPAQDSPLPRSPRIIWVAGHHGLDAATAHREGANLQAALVAMKLADPPSSVELVKLEGHVFARRTKTRVRAAGQET